jgi:hypothetical protein
VSTGLFRLAYCSRNVIRDVHGNVEREIEHILVTARRNNAREGVTGALLYDEGCFAQVLEGPLAAVERVFERIQCDFRHSDVIVLENAPQNERLFGNWSMAHASEAAGKQSGEGLNVARAFAVRGSLAGDQVVTYLQGVLARQEEWAPA